MKLTELYQKKIIGAITCIFHRAFEDSGEGQYAAAKRQTMPITAK
jgi:hypothetical protein